MRGLLILALALSSAACRETPSDAADAGAPDAAGAQSGAPDAGAPDAGGSGARDAGPAPADAGTPVDIDSCGDIAAPGCLWNEDCEQGHTCRSYDSERELRCCVPGSRGARGAGESCATEADCLYGRCIERNDGARFCAGPCTTNLDCPGSMFCNIIFHWCVPRDAGAPPESCGQVNLSQCFANEHCDDDERCENLGGPGKEVLCCTAGARGTGRAGAACASELDCAYGRCFDGLCSDACDGATDPCPPATMICGDISGLCEPK